MTTPPTNDAAPRGGGAGVNDPKSQANHSANGPPIPDGITREAWLLLAQPEDDRWVIRERDANGEVIGTAYRDASGAKTFAPGGKRGLIVAWPLDAYAGSTDRDPVLIGEGASDTAALLGLGLDAVGVPMAGHCGQMLAELLADRHAAIVADADEAGRRGAEKVAAALLPRCASVRIIEPPGGAKDARAAVIGGADRAAFLSLALCAERVKRPEATAARTPRREPPAPYVPFPVDALPEPIRSFIVESAHAIGCDPAYIALPLLAALGMAVGNSRAILLKRGWVEPPILWCAIVGESGTLKTPAFRAALKPIRAAQARWFAEHEHALVKWKVEHAQHEAALQVWKAEAIKAAKRGAEAPAPPEAESEPTCRRCLVSDTTVEALAPIVLGNPRGVLLARDELAGWIGGFDQYKQGGRGGADVAHWLSMHSGESITVDRKTGAFRTIHVPSAAVGIAGGIQPGTLRRAIGVEHAENGLLARLLLAMPPRRLKRWTEAEVPEALEAQLKAIVGALFQLQPDTDDDGNPRPRLIGLDADAQKAWRAFYDAHAREEVDLQAAEASAWSKLEGGAARFALIVHLVRAAAGDRALRNPNQIDAASVGAGVVLSRWFGNEARRVYAVLGEGEGDARLRRLAEWIEGQGGTATARDLTRGPREFRGDPEHAERALANLVAAGVAEWVDDAHDAAGGRPTRRVRLIRGRGDGGDGGDGDETYAGPEDIGGSVAVAGVASAEGGDSEAPGCPVDDDLGAGCSDYCEEGGPA